MQYILGLPTFSYALELAPRGDNPDPLHIETCNKILKTAHDSGIKAVMHCAGSEFAIGAAERGFDMVMLTSDLACMTAGSKMQLENFKKNVT